MIETSSIKELKSIFGSDSLTIMMLTTSTNNVKVLGENEGRFNCGQILQIVLLFFLLI